MMHNAAAATLALDGLALGARVVACGVDDDQTAFGKLYEHRALANGRRYWRDLTSGGVALQARQIVAQYDDMVIAYLPDTEPHATGDDT